MKITTRNPNPLTATAPRVFVGLDVHKKSIVLAARVERDQRWLLERTFCTGNLSKLRKALKKLSSHGEVRCCYEASGAGYYLYRLMREWGFYCEVIAPSLIPTKSGDRRKCDRLDARKLCAYFDSGLLTAVSVPDAEREAVRGLVRCRRQMKEDIVRAKHQLNHFLHTKGLIYRDGQNWSKMHRAWLARQEYACSADQETFDFYFSTLEYRERRLEEIDKRIQEIAENHPEYRESVRLLRAYRGVGIYTAMVLLTELGDIRRFGSPSGLMSYVGLTPSVKQSGESGNKAGSITKAGSARCRHVLVQAAWNCARRPAKSALIRKRQEGLPAWVVEHSWHAQKRLHKRFKHLETTIGRSKAVVAVAREFVGFLGYALMRQANGGVEL